MSPRRARSACWAAAALAALLVAGCAGKPAREAPPEAAAGASRDGGPKVSPYPPAQEDPSTRGDYVAGGLYKPGVADTTPDYVPDVDAIPEPEVVELPRSRYGNGPTYTVLGKRYRVLDDPRGFVETGTASYYGQKFHGRLTSNQEVYDMYAFTAAHKSLPLPSFARVTNLDTGQSVVVRVNDRGPFHEGRVVDLSYAAAVKIGVHPRGTARVEVRALAPGEDAAHRPADVRAASAAPTAAAEEAQPLAQSAMDGLVSGLPVAASGPEPAAVPAASTAAAPEAAPSMSGPAPDAGAAPAPDAAGDGLLLQVAAFDSRANAERALERLRGAGIADARLQDGSAGGRALWRLRVGPVAASAVAELSARIAGLGFGAPHPVRE